MLRTDKRLPRGLNKILIYSDSISLLLRGILGTRYRYRYGVSLSLRGVAVATGYRYRYGVLLSLRGILDVRYRYRYDIRELAGRRLKL